MITPVLLAYGFAVLLMICSTAIELRCHPGTKDESGKYWGLGLLCFLFAIIGSFFL